MNFRPLDDILDDAVTTLTRRDGKNTPPDLQLSRSDLAKFTSMKCVAAAMKHLCEVKGGIFSPSHVKPCLRDAQKSHQKSVSSGFQCRPSWVTSRRKSADWRQRTALGSLWLWFACWRRTVSWRTGKRLYSRVSFILRLTARLTDPPPDGRLKAACDLVAHHLPTDVKTELMSAHEYANPSPNSVVILSFWQFLGLGHSREGCSRRIGRDGGCRHREGEEKGNNEGHSTRRNGQETKDQGFARRGSVEEGEC